MLKLTGGQDFAARYADLPLLPLRVTLHLRPGGRLAGYDPLLLDGLLARAVVELATAGAGLANTPDAYDFPLPLACLWRNAAGWPLWAATPFEPQGAQTRDVAYWHKRSQSGRWTGTAAGKFNIAPTDGRWMERRVPLPTQVAECWTAECIGNADALAELLGMLTFAGKRRSSGFGEVAHWEVAPGAFDLVRDDRLTRALPTEAAGLLAGRPADAAVMVGWTPPQWKASLWQPGWRAGTRVLPC